tara:strand:- start:597 stop:1217 length:621 start_codon:yes stop_codon:yes gene_type:complete
MEYSGVSRKAFEKVANDNNYDWNVVSCDLLPADDGAENHIQGDALDVIQSKHWGLILIHPPCTALAVSGNAWYGAGMEKNAERLEAIKWTTSLWNLVCDHSDYAVMENPVGVLPFKPAQYIQPYEFGHPESKKTGLWLHNLPKLQPADDVKAVHDALPKKDRMKMHYLSPSKDRWKIRSKTYEGIGRAIAKQHGIFVNNEPITHVK